MQRLFPADVRRFPLPAQSRAQREDNCTIFFWGIGEELAGRADAALDGEVSSGDWMNSGRVEFRPAEHRLSVMVRRR